MRLEARRWNLFSPHRPFSARKYIWILHVEIYPAGWPLWLLSKCEAVTASHGLNPTDRMYNLVYTTRIYNVGEEEKLLPCHRHSRVERVSVYYTPVPEASSLFHIFSLS